MKLKHQKNLKDHAPAPKVPGRRQTKSALKVTPQDELKAIAQLEANIPLWKDFAIFLRHNKKWWLLPIIVILLFLSLMVAMSSTAIAPFIYTVF